ncbi:Indoleamine 2,3-dioxygenase [Rickenella mellea]|uniref:Indoleamine 2,3-dioxygenase n=1 Tax=Rickenella mellea TaxID=50990 RepID=A0A4R5XGA7_9AGAM|nr:Indoleamine 2,3-dioxygenase [Rickenella mellea]
MATTPKLHNRFISDDLTAPHDFDVYEHTGFMPRRPPIHRLPPEWETWETVMQDAMRRKLKLGNRADVAEADRQESESWHATVREVPLLSIDELKMSDILLHRAHHVLTHILHFYVHSMPLSDPIIIPKSIGVPLLQVLKTLETPPVLAYSDIVLYNWTINESASAENPHSPIPTPENICVQSQFTDTEDEAVFYLTSAKIELAGAAALQLIQNTLEESLSDPGDTSSLHRIARNTVQLSVVLADLTVRLLAVRDGCDPEVFYHKIQPWISGQDGTRKWVFEGASEAGFQAPEELVGATAGQSSLIPAIDNFLGVHGHHYADNYEIPTPPASTPTPSPKPLFLKRMELYMSRPHRLCLEHISETSRMRSIVIQHADNTELREAYNNALRALRAFRDAHLRIVALYIVGPARRISAGLRANAHNVQMVGEGTGGDGLKGTGGTDLMPFLKGLRDKTTEAEICRQEKSEGS